MVPKEITAQSFVHRAYTGAFLSLLSQFTGMPRLFSQLAPRQLVGMGERERANRMFHSVANGSSCIPFHTRGGEYIGGKRQSMARGPAAT